MYSLKDLHSSQKRKKRCGKCYGENITNYVIIAARAVVTFISEAKKGFLRGYPLLET